ncbi:MAG: T9SS type A sorting domain-containing protein, partial [Bacteroidota bacterium]|nr:T9SS type A sorting domain-containing protein [Bacteroidota bacterium]
DRRLFGGEPLHISLIDMLGNEVWSTDYLSSSITEYISCSTKIPDGTYILRAAITGHTESRKIVIRN